MNYSFDSEEWRIMQTKYYEGGKKWKKKKATIVMCDGVKNHGGLNDRLKGALVSYYLSKKNNRQFYIYWDMPFKLEDYLVPNKIDWRISPSEINYQKPQSFPAIMPSNIHQFFLKTKIERFIFKSWFASNKELHVYSNLNIYTEHFPELFNELFKPSDALQNELNKYNFTNKYVSFSFRFQNLLGDFNDAHGQELNEASKKELIEKNVNEFMRYKENVPQDYKIFIASDSKTFLNEIKGKDERIFVSEEAPTYTDSKIKDESLYFNHLKTFVDFYLLMRAEELHLFITDGMHNSGFVYLAAVLGKKKRIKHYF